VLRQPVLGALANRWSQNRCELLDGTNAKVGELRILAHDEKTLWLAADGAPFPDPQGIARVRIVAKYFDLVTNHSPGFGGVKTTGTKPVPVANVRIGFAFHEDPSQGLANGLDPKRYPQAVGTFAFDLSDPGAIAAMRGKPFVQWELLFNTLYTEAPGNLRPEGLDPGAPLPEIHSLVVPYRF
jgi:hypothetical protein